MRRRWVRRLKNERNQLVSSGTDNRTSLQMDRDQKENAGKLFRERVFLKIQKLSRMVCLDTISSAEIYPSAMGNYAS